MFKALFTFYSVGFNYNTVRWALQVRNRLDLSLTSHPHYSPIRYCVPNFTLGILTLLLMDSVFHFRYYMLTSYYGR